MLWYLRRPLSTIFRCYFLNQKTVKDTELYPRPTSLYCSTTGSTTKTPPFFLVSPPATMFSPRVTRIPPSRPNAPAVILQSGYFLRLKTPGSPEGGWGGGAVPTQQVVGSYQACFFFQPRAPSPTLPYRHLVTMRA